VTVTRAPQHDRRHRLATLPGTEQAVRGFGKLGDRLDAVLVRPLRTCAGDVRLDEQVLAQDGVSDLDLDRFRAVPGSRPLAADLFLDPLENPT
jgi:hypothetical protein